MPGNGDGGLFGQWEEPGNAAAQRSVVLVGQIRCRNKQVNQPCQCLPITPETLFPTSAKPIALTRSASRSRCLSTTVLLMVDVLSAVARRSRAASP